MNIVELHNNHRVLFTATIALFLALTIFAAIAPAIRNEQFKPLPGAQELTPAEAAGKRSYIANGCVACHTQQVRNIAMDDNLGKRPSIASDYANIRRQDIWRNTATLMGTARIGPDLTTIGSRQPSDAWHLIHLYQPRAVVKESIMPAYRWMFEVKENPAADDVVVNVPEEYAPKKGKVVAKQEALDLTAYLLSLKQISLPDGTEGPDFLYNRPQAKIAASGDASAAGESEGSNHAHGQEVYAANCQVCHQDNGEGLPGAFPALKGSEVAALPSAEKMVSIVLNGYEARKDQGYPPMPPIAITNEISDEDIHAVINYVRTAWGNSAGEASKEEIQQFIEKHRP